MNYPRKKKSARSGVILSVPLLILVLAIMASLLIIYSTPVLTIEKRTSGNLTFSDGSGNLINGMIEISMTGAPSGGRSNVNSITWRNAPNAWIYFDAIGTKSISINLRISGDTPNGRVSLENYGGAVLPAGVDEPAPGMPVKYVELHSTGVSFTNADVSIHYTNAELKGLDEKSLVIYSYYGGAWNEQPSKVDPAKNVVTATVDSLTIFAVSTGVPDEIVVRDARNKPVISHIRTYDELRNLKKDVRTSALETANVTGNGELEVDALESKNVAVSLKIKAVNRGEVVLDDFGKMNPVSSALPGMAVKYVEIGAKNISFSSADITIQYTDAELNGGSEDALTIYHWNGASWDAVPTIIDKVNKTLSATTASLSLWGVATLYQQALRCDAGTSIGVDTTNFTCGTASTPYDIGLLMDNTAGTSTTIRIGTAANGPWVYAYFINNTEFSTDVNVTGYSASISMRVTTAGRTDYGWYELGYYDPNGVAGNMEGNFVGLFNSTAARTTATVQTAYAISFGGKSGIIPANHKLAIRVWTNATGGTDRPYFYSFSTAAAANSSVYITIAYANAYISGYVTNKSSGLPLSGITVQTNTSLTATTDASGYYIFTGLSNGTYIVSASLYGYDTNSTTKTVADANVTNANISLSPSASYQLSGYVTDQSSGNPISGAIIKTNTSLMTTTNATGYYSFTVYNWTHLITASKTGYTSNSTAITVNGAPVNNANISLLAFQPRILVATNRYVILDDPLTTGKTAQTAAGFALAPFTGWSTNQWSGNQTQIRGYALVIDENGMPINNTNVTFVLRNWNSAVTNTSPNIRTNSNGLANYTFDMNAANYYGNWNITATAIGKSDSKGFIYNWFGCQAGGCEDHTSRSVGTATPSIQNSPYTLGRETVISQNGAHSTTNDCAGCHRSYGGTGGGTQFTGQPIQTADVHKTDTCITCHATITTHTTNQPIKSCSNCHNRTDLSDKNTTGGSPLRSNYSGLVASTGHNPNSTIPCIICHGPMHNITKPDESQRFLKNNDTESTQCTFCHQSYNLHNNTVNCTLCHSDDAHAIKVFAQNATYITLNIDNPSTARGNCTNCHQNNTFYSILKSQPNATNQTGRNPPQVAVPLEHSNNNSAGTRWNQTPGYWTNSLQLSWCLYCHGNTTHSATALGWPAEFDGINVVNSSISLTASWCSSCHWQGYTNGSDTYDSTINTFNGESLPVPPEITGNDTYGANKSKPEYFNHTGISIKSDNSCYGCHRNGTSALSITGFMHDLTDVSTRVSGPDCIGCHDYTKTDQDALHRINNSDMKKGVHANLNKNTTNSTNISADNKKCWGCHTSNGSEPRPYYLNYYDMGDRFANPYKCYDCHNSTGKAYANVSTAPQVYQHFKGGSNVTAANASDNSSSCVICHDLNELKVSYSENDIYNSGLSNASHYTKNRTDLRTWDSGRAANCSYCHQNTSTAFSVAMFDAAYNSSIKNHSTANLPTCYNATCHKSGWIHNSTLDRPALNATNTSSYCRNCHPDKWKHNNTLDCGSCHFNSSSKDTIHPVKYLLQNASYGTGNSTAVTCITCHQTTIVDARLSQVPPKIPSSLHHSDNASNGTLWNSTAYWTPTNPLTACIYCHNDTKHNTSALGRPAGWQGNNVVNSSFSSGTWCASCHYKNYSGGGKNYADMTQAFSSANLSVPPEITNGSYAIRIFNRSNYYNHSLKGYTDEICRLCHGINLSSASSVSDLMHNISGSSCTGCHYSFEAMNNTTRPDRYVDPVMYNTSLHRSLSCTNCHTQGHRNMGARKACEDCHAVQANPVTDKDRHNITASPSTYFVGASNVVMITDCTTCHSASLYNTATATYGYWKPKDCDYCHTYPDKYFE